MNLRANAAVRALRARRVGAFERRQHAFALMVTRLRADAQRLPHIVAAVEGLPGIAAPRRVIAAPLPTSDI